MQKTLQRFVFITFLLVTSTLFSQKITGKVSDEAGGLPGVSVSIKGTTIGTNTDFDGNFTLNNVQKNSTLVFSYIGYITKEVNLDGKTVINVTLVESLESLDEIVITGYGQTQNKKTVTNSISTISSKQIEELPLASPENALQGTAPGVVVVQTSGSPGAPLTVRMRGIGSPNASNPLYIVDGLPVPNLQYLNSDDIKSFSLLKDASATAIYGARGGNGVVLVETKRGFDTELKPKVSISGFYGNQSLANKPDLMNAKQYGEYYNAGIAAAGGVAPNGFRGAFTDTELAALPDTDWYDVIFENSPIKNTSASLTMGNDKISFAVSGGLFDQEGIVGGSDGKANFERDNIRGNIDWKVKDNFTLSLSTDFSQLNTRTISLNNGGTGVALMNYINAIPSIYPTHAENGEIFNMGRQSPAPVYNGVALNTLGAVTNPLWSLDIQNNEAKTDISVIGASANWKPIPELNTRVSYSKYKLESLFRNFTPLVEYPTQTFSTTGFVTYGETPTLFETEQFTATAEYDFSKFVGEDHELKFLGGYEVLENRLENGDNRSINDGDLWSNNFGDLSFSNDRINGLNVITLPGNIAETALISYFGKADYNYKEKYLASFAIRNDRSSNFGPNNRSGWFPSASAGWVLSEEDIFSDVDFVNLLKLRASWGVSGQDASPRNLAYLSTVNSNISSGYGGSTGISLTGLANPDLKWEEITQTNIGIDLNAFNNSVAVTIDYYIKKTSDVLLQANTPLATGLNPSVVNVGDVKNSGFEILTSYRSDSSKEFSWNASFNIGINKNEITNLGNNGQALQGGFTGQLYADPITLTTVGEPISSFYGYQVEGIDAAGNLVFKDLDGVGSDKTQPTIGDKTFIGNPLPDFTYGINLGANYKGFDFSAFLYGSQGNDIFDATIRYDAVGSNRPASYGQAGATKNIVLGGTNGEHLVSDFHVKDGSFLKLKNVALGYTLPEKVSNYIKAEKIRFYVSGQNLFVLTGYDGVDPEIGGVNGNSILDMGIDRGFYPQPKQVLLGFQLNF